MSKFNKVAFKENAKEIIIILVVVVCFFIGSIVGFTEDKGYETKELEGEINSQIHKLVINEVMSSNGGVLLDEEGNSCDWIELYNGNSHEINLANYGLSDKPNEVKWAFPEIIIQPNEYKIIYLTGQTKNGPYANFSLKSGGGETLSLRNPNGKVVDAVETIKLPKNNSLARDSQGNWMISNKPTPGFENSTLGYEGYVSSLKVENDGISIAEVLPSNKGNFIIDNILPGFIEIVNNQDTAVNIMNYSISDSLTVPFKWKLPDITLQPKQRIVVYTSGLDRTDTNLHASFKFNSGTGVAVLSNNKGQIIDTAEYENLTNGKSLVKVGDTYYISGVATPGYSSDTDSNVLHPNKESLLINEVMNNNTKYIAQNGGQYYDWIELKNNSKEAINLGDYYISSSDNDFKQFKLPEVTLQPGGFYVLIASGNDKYTNKNYTHTNFKIALAEGIYLSKDNKIVDAAYISETPVNQSYGRGKDGGFYYITTPTPGGENNSGTKEISFAPVLETPAGVFNDVESVTVSVKAAGTVYYTTNGSNPNSESKQYTGAITLKKTTVLKFASYESGKRKSPVITASYIINENHKLPVMSVSLSSANFSKINNNPWNTSVQVPAYAEFFEDGDSFSISCGLKLFGGSTRGHAKKSYSLKFKKVYGAAYLDYQVFENVDAFRYDTIVLRSGSQDYYESMIRDELATSIVNGVTELDVQEHKAAVLYINGKYWGLYFLREKVDEMFIANNHNVSSAKTNIVRIDGEVMVGSKKNYNAIINYVKTHDMSQSKHYNYIQTKVDIDALCDYWIGELYTTNNDIVNQRYYDNPNVNDGKLRPIFYDFDFAFYNYTHNYFNFLTSPYGSGYYGFDNSLIRNLLKNSQFRKRFLERLSYNLQNVWTNERLNAKIDELVDLIKDEMPRNQKRWGLTMGGWNSAIKDLKGYVSKRRTYFLRHIKSYFKLSDKEMKEYFG